MVMKRAFPALILVFLVACRAMPGTAGPGPTTSASGGGDLDGAWQLDSGTHGGANLPIIADSPITMTIDGSEIGGRAACNTYGGTIETDGRAVTISALSMTEMGCDQPVMAAEAAFIAALADVNGADRSDDELRLTGDGVDLTFAFVPPVADADLTGTTWVLDSLISGDTASSVGGDPATLEFTDDGTLTGGTGCRGFGASYSASGAEIAVTDFSNDDRACAEELTAQDEHALAVLSEGFTFAINGNRLTLTAGEMSLGYTASDG